MAVMYERLKGLIQSVADAAGGMLQILVGVPGSQLEYPSSDIIDEQVSETYDTGGEWVATQALPTVLDRLGFEMDAAMMAWCAVLTNATGVAPSIQASRGVTSVTKEEVKGEVTFNLSPAYTTLNYFTFAQIHDEFYVSRLTTLGASVAAFQFYDVAALQQSVNDRRVLFVSVGQV
jgi:hypothetical protein